MKPKNKINTIKWLEKSRPEYLRDEIRAWRPYKCEVKMKNPTRVFSKIIGVCIYFLLQQKIPLKLVWSLDNQGTMHLF